MTPRRPSAPHATDAARFFDRDAVRYDASYADGSPVGHTLRARLAVTLDLLGDGGGSVLDAGMGPGRLCAELARRGFAVSGVDASSEMVAIARSRVPEAAERLLQSNLEDLPFASESFEAIVATGVLEYLGVIPPALSELARVLRPGGLAVLSVPNVKAPYVIWRRAAYYPAIRLLKRRRFHGARPAPFRRRRPPSRTAFVAMVEAAGLEIESVRYAAYVVLPSPLDELFPAVTLRIAERLEGSSPRVGSVLGTQVVLAARKPG